MVIDVTMMSFLAQVAGSGWSITFEGISPWLAMGLGMLTLALSIWAYLRKVSANIPIRRRWMMGMIRGLAMMMFLVLLTKPVVWRSIQEKVREPMVVLVDGSESMQMVDRRDRYEDLQRLAIALGKVSPTMEISSKPGGSRNLEQLELPEQGVSRWDLVKAVADNAKMKWWERLAEVADLQFYVFADGAKRLRMNDATGHQQSFWNSTQWKQFFASDDWTVKSSEGGGVTAIGDAIQQVLNEPRAQAVGAVLLISDGGQNGGSSAIEAAQVAREKGAELYVYGVGVTEPMDLQLSEIRMQKLAFIRERSEVSARLKSQSLPQQQVLIRLLADGDLVEQKTVPMGGDAEQVVKFFYTPQTAGEVLLQIEVDAVAGEASVDNNLVGSKMRVTDSKFRVLLIEQEPRWDFRYLLDYLQRDPRLEVQCVMIDGEPGLEQVEDSPFLANLPEDRESYFQSHVIILGDVDPTDLGAERMEMMAEWVESGGGLIFLTGSNFNPRSYMGTPLEELLPVVPDTVTSLERMRQRAPEPFKLELTKQGKESAYLQMDEDEVQSMKLWEEFQGVRWTAPVARVKAGAEVLLVDSRDERKGRYGKSPVFAMQGFGAGRCVYFGTDETWRWRSRTGEKYYSILWGQIMQTLSLQLMEGASPLTQLKTDRRQYRVGDRIVISGKAYEQGFAPLLQPSLHGEVTMEGDESYRQTLSLNAVEKNFYQGEWVPQKAGVYHYVTSRDKDGVLSFEVIEHSLEISQSGMNEKLLRAMAETSGGRFLREEDLYGLPDLMAAQVDEISIYQKQQWYFSGWFLSGLLGLCFAEWGLRRWSRLK